MEDNFSKWAQETFNSQEMRDSIEKRNPLVLSDTFSGVFIPKQYWNGLEVLCLYPGEIPQERDLIKKKKDFFLEDYIKLKQLNNLSFTSHSIQYFALTKGEERDNNSKIYKIHNQRGIHLLLSRYLSQKIVPVVHEEIQLTEPFSLVQIYKVEQKPKF
jgi:hypothetical protein